VIGTVCATSPDTPHRPCEEQHKEKEEGSRHLQPESAAHPAERAQEASRAAREALAGLPGGASRCALVCSLVCSGLVQPYLSGLRSRPLRFGGDALTGYASGDPQPDAEKAPYAVGSHFVMMVAAVPREPFFLTFLNSLLLLKRQRQ